jgi:hypothetical protein
MPPWVGTALVVLGGWLFVGTLVAFSHGLDVPVERAG